MEIMNKDTAEERLRRLIVFLDRVIVPELEAIEQMKKEEDEKNNTNNK